MGARDAGQGEKLPLEMVNQFDLGPGDLPAFWTSRSSLWLVAASLPGFSRQNVAAYPPYLRTYRAPRCDGPPAATMTPLWRYGSVRQAWSPEDQQRHLTPLSRVVRSDEAEDWERSDLDSDSERVRRLMYMGLIT